LLCAGVSLRADGYCGGGRFHTGIASGKGNQPLTAIMVGRLSRKLALCLLSGRLGARPLIESVCTTLRCPLRDAPCRRRTILDAFDFSTSLTGCAALAESSTRAVYPAPRIHLCFFLSLICYTGTYILTFYADSLLHCFVSNPSLFLPPSRPNLLTTLRVRIVLQRRSRLQLP